MKLLHAKYYPSPYFCVVLDFSWVFCFCQSWHFRGDDISETFIASTGEFCNKVCLNQKVYGNVKNGMDRSVTGSPT